MAAPRWATRRSARARPNSAARPCAAKRASLRRSVLTSGARSNPNTRPRSAGECSLSASGRLMRPQRHQQQCQQTGAQTIESGADAAVNFIDTLEDAALHQGWQGQQNSSPGHRPTGAKQRCGIVQQAQIGQQPITAPIGWIRVLSGRGTFFSDRGKSGQVWVRTLRRGWQW